MYFKNEKDGYILGFGIGDVCEEITAEEYEEIKAASQNRPTPPDGYAYRLRTDLTWELVELPPVPDEPTPYTQEVLETMNNAELEQILYSYGRKANMTKENLVSLILQLQGGGSNELV